MLHKETKFEERYTQQQKQIAIERLIQQRTKKDMERFNV